MVTIVAGLGERDVAAAQADGDDLWLPADVLPAVVGLTLKPEGLCHDALCVPVPRGREAAFVRDGRVNLAAFWRHTERPWARSEAGDLWVFVANARERADEWLSLQAPDCALPDLAGNMNALSGQRGKKVFLVTWESW
ncbi:MAG: hypothetical protein EXQ97_00055 [Alphaproteobacteria bacterium]|nr:hypothetical protein [Alphaproteobacteria bacterium]